VAAQVLAIAGNYSHILFPATAGGKNVAPRVAAKLDVAQISDITKVVSADTFERPIYAGNAIATVQSATPSRSSPCAPPASTPPPPPAAAPPSKPPPPQPTAARALRGQRDRQERPPELTAAKIIVSGGRALGSSEKFNEV
jgi:electron transfer flavoprotein alpha subunit